nr:MAG TPA: hypothetical protein [Caudoviricetes sp.]
MSQFLGDKKGANGEAPSFLSPKPPINPCTLTRCEPAARVIALRATNCSARLKRVNTYIFISHFSPKFFPFHS